MNKSQIKNWIIEHIKKNPEVAEEYKEQRLARLNAELSDNKRAFNRDGYYSYKNPRFSKSIIENEDTISEVQSKTAENLLVDDFMQRYGDTRSTEEMIEYIKSLDDEDRYIAGVFQGTKHNINCQEDLEHRESYNDEELPNIRKIYKNGLSKREEYISVGAKFHQELLEKNDAYLREFEDIEERGPKIIEKLIDEEVELKKFHCRSLAQMSVVDAFDKMGAHPAPKQAEEIEKIVEMHDPAVVEAAVQTLQEFPTKNMIALAQNLKNKPAQDKSTLRVMKAVDYISLACGIILTSSGLISLFRGEGLHLYLPIGLADLALGASGIRRHTRKQNNLDEKETLLSDCLQDLIDEVETQEAFNKGLEC